MNHALPAIQHAYAQCAYTPQHNQWTVLASVFLTNNDDYKIIGLATGTKCLPATRLSPRGESLHDSHAEALARRAALRWLLQETQSPASPWLTQTPNGRYTLRPSVKLNLYVSTLPCGDASMRTLAALQDPTIASLKSTSLFPSLAPGAASRGRDDYARLGVLRTKPGRADSPPTPCLSCSDKIARWSVLGIQGALGAHLLEPLYLENIIIGEVPSGLREIAFEDCTRAFSGRVGVIPDLPEGYALHPPTIHFTKIPFIHSRTILQSSTSCIESLCLVADTPPEILINGLKRGVSPKHRYREKSRPSISRIAMLNLVLNLTPQSPSTPPPNLNPTPNPTSIESNLNLDPTYHHLKLQSHSYQAARSKLTGPDGPFSGWVLSGSHFQNFNARGEEVVPASTPDSLSLSLSLLVASSLPTQSSSEVENVSEVDF